MSLDSALSKAQQDVPECVAVGYVDMSTGMLLGVRTLDSHPTEVLDLVAAVFVMGLVMFDLQRAFASLDTTRLSSLKD